VVIIIDDETTTSDKVLHNFKQCNAEDLFVQSVRLHFSVGSIGPLKTCDPNTSFLRKLFSASTMTHKPSILLFPAERHISVLYFLGSL
jgi:hypothetical protein